MTLLDSISSLTKKVNDVTKEFNITEASLDAQVTSAQNNQASVEAIETSANNIKLSANTIYNNISSDRTSAEALTTFSEIQEVLQTIAVNAVDVFIYDTSKDSDGGAWRYKTQNTSWYQEELNTTTRGSRREFPAVAVIVAEANKITIYDGDDPSLPMWMVFNVAGGSNMLLPSVTGIYALNGILGFSTSGAYGFGVANFLADTGARTSLGYSSNYNGNIEQRNDLLSQSATAGPYPKIVNSTVNDVAMTVLPDSPIDPATGLPVPTIAVATDGGVSIIHNDGTVADLTYVASGNNKSYFVEFDKNGQGIWWSNRESYNGANFPSYINWYKELPLIDTSLPPDKYFVNASIPNYWGNFNRYGFISTSDGIAISTDIIPLQILAQNYETVNKGMISHINTDYNTGYMVGDIKVAVLSDTDDTDLVGSGEIVQNGSFDSDSDWTKDTGWSIANGEALYDGINYGNINQSSSNIISGKTYKVDITIGTNESGIGQYFVTLKGSLSATYNHKSGTTYTHYITAGTSTTGDITIYSNSAYPFTVSKISVVAADAGRSSKLKGLAVSSTTYDPWNYDLDFNFGEDNYIVDRETSDFTNSITHFRDSNATMVGGYGPELVTNGGFDTDSNWNKGTGWTISGGQVNINSAPFVSLYQQNIGLEEGKTYEISFNVTSYVSGSISVAIGTNGSGLSSGSGAISSVGFYKFTGIFNSGQTDQILSRAESNGFIGSIDNISVREIPKIQWAPHNLISRSEEFNNWTKFIPGDSVSTDIEQAPDGNTTADVLTFDDTATNHVFRNNWPAILGVKYRLGVYLKYNGVQWVLLSDNFISPGRLWVDLQNGVLGINNANAFDPSIIPLDNDWYYVSYTTQESVAVSPQLQIQPTLADNNSGFNYSGNGTTTKLSVWGAHVYRVDLGGMVDNYDQPVGLEKYVPTTSSAKYLPRRNHHTYNGTVWVNDGLLHESKERTNLLNYSNDFTNSFWAVPRTDITENVISTTSPDGFNNANLFIPTAGTGGDHGVYSIQSINLVENGILSVYAKKGPGNYKLSLHPTAGNVSAIFNLNTGKIDLNNSGQEANIEYFGNGWYRCSIKVLPNANAFVKIYVANENNDVSYTPDGTSGIYIWGAQLEQGETINGTPLPASTPSSYIPTYGATGTRKKETFSISASNLPYSTTAMTIQTEGKISYDETTDVPQVYRWYQDGNNFLSFRFDTQIAGSVRPMWIMETGAQNRYIRGSYGEDGINIPFNVAGRYSPTVLDGAIDGFEFTETNPGISIPNLSTTDLELGYDYMGTIERFRMWGDDIKDDGIMYVSEPPLQATLGLAFNSTDYSYTVLDWKE